MMKDNLSGWTRVKVRVRLGVAIGLGVTPTVLACLLLWGDWKNFYGALVGHYLFWQAIVAFLYDKTIWPGGFEIDCNPCLRAGVAAMYLLCYLLTSIYFFIGF